MSRAPVDAETRAAAVADVLSGESVTTTAKKYGVSRRAVQMWRNQAGVPSHGALQTNERDYLRRRIVEHTNANLDALAAIAQHVQNPAWLLKQNAHDLAILYGVIFDKLARLAVAVAGDGPDESDGGRGAAGRPVGRLPSPP